MYQISRSMYRRLGPMVVAGPGDPTGARGRQQVLEACESALSRMALDRGHFAHPARSVFEEIRSAFTIRDQLRVRAIVNRHVELADRYLARLPANLTAFGDRRQCRASTRRGTPCRREPLTGKEYCPSHKHLEEQVLPRAA